MNTILLTLALIALLIIATPFLLLIVIVAITAFSPEFNDYDEIVECKACRGDELGECWDYVPHWSTCDNPTKFRRRAKA